ncbi:WD repeat-containing protein 31-like [Lethenteron reissneri]|uniref:WD repeat-containing protein 31-like n=1 Tax=Lethenteron reissneri TaxID=7753 RepID=UPI002AB74B9A|nr:WD repeat-containing protein 31-like [Lethenteron reissneri]
MIYCLQRELLGLVWTRCPAWCVEPPREPSVPRVNVCTQGKDAETPGRLVKNLLVVQLPQAPPRYLSGFNGARRLPRLSAPQVSMGKLQSKPSVRPPHKYRVESPACVLGEASVRHFPRVHRDAVASLALLGPGLSLSGSKDCTVVLFDWERGELSARLLGHARDVTKVACVPGGTHVFSASRDRTACMWHRAHPADGPVATFSGHELVLTGLSLNHDGSVLCTGSRDNALCFWDVDTGVCVRRASLPRNLVTDLCWVPGSALVAQASEDKTVRLWDSRTAQVSVLFPPKCHIQTSCAVSPSATHLLSTSAGVNAEGCEATLWDGRQPCGAVREFHGHSQSSSSCCFLPGGLLGTASHDGTARVWELHATECVCVAILGGPLTAMCSGGDGRILCGGFHSGVHVLELISSHGPTALRTLARF